MAEKCWFVSTKKLKAPSKIGAFYLENIFLPLIL